jgi:hypothetical protein
MVLRTRFGIVRAVTALLFLMLSLQILGSAFTVEPENAEHHIAFRKKESTTCIIGSILMNLVKDGTDKTLEDTDDIARVLLEDLSLIAASLSDHHAAQFVQSPTVLQYDVRPPLHKVNCVFLI